MTGLTSIATRYQVEQRPTLPYKVKGKISMDELRKLFRQVTLQLYETKTRLSVLERDVFPLFSDDILFEDPWQFLKGYRLNRIEWRGAHCT